MQWESRSGSSHICLNNPRGFRERSIEAGPDNTSRHGCSLLGQPKEEHGGTRERALQSSRADGCSHRVSEAAATLINGTAQIWKWKPQKVLSLHTSGHCSYSSFGLKQPPFSPPGPKVPQATIPQSPFKTQLSCCLFHEAFLEWLMPRAISLCSPRVSYLTPGPHLSGHFPISLWVLSLTTFIFTFPAAYTVPGTQ